MFLGVTEEREKKKCGQGCGPLWAFESIKARLTVPARFTAHYTMPRRFTPTMYNKYVLTLLYPFKYIYIYIG